MAGQSSEATGLTYSDIKLGEMCHPPPDRPSITGSRQNLDLALGESGTLPPSLCPINRLPWGDGTSYRAFSPPHPNCTHQG